MDKIAPVVIVLGLLGYALYLGWPVTLWLGAAALGAWGLRRAAAQAKAGQPEENLSAGVVGALAKTSLTITIGLAIVWVAQLILKIWPPSNIASMLALEHTLIGVRKALAFALQPIGFFVLVLGVLLLDWKGGDFGPIKKALGYRRTLGTVSGVIAVVCSFTFFAGQAANADEPEWIAARRSEIADAVGTIRSAEIEATALAVVRHDIDRMSSTDQAYLGAFLDRVKSEPAEHQDAVVRKKAAELAPEYAEAVAAARAQRDKLPANELSTDDEALRDSARWIDDKADAPVDAPSMEKVEIVEKEVETATVARDGAREAVKLALKGRVPSVGDPLADSLVSAVVGVLTKKLADVGFDALFHGRFDKAQEVAASIDENSKKWEVVPTAVGMPQEGTADVLATRVAQAAIAEEAQIAQTEFPAPKSTPASRLTELRLELRSAKTPAERVRLSRAIREEEQQEAKNAWSERMQKGLEQMRREGAIERAQGDLIRRQQLQREMRPEGRSEVAEHPIEIP